MKLAWTTLAIGLFISSGCRVIGEAFDSTLVENGRPVNSASVVHLSPSELARSSGRQIEPDGQIDELSAHQTGEMRRSGGLGRLPKTTSSQVRFAKYEQEKGDADTAKESVQEKLPTLPRAAAPKFGLTLSEVEDIALGNNPAMAMARAQLDAARGKWLQVGLPPNPVIG